MQYFLNICFYCKLQIILFYIVTKSDLFFHKHLFVILKYLTTQHLVASLARPSALPVPVTPCVSLPGLHSRRVVGRVVKQQNVVFPPVLEARYPRSSRQQV